MPHTEYGVVHSVGTVWRPMGGVLLGSPLLTLWLLFCSPHSGMYPKLADAIMLVIVSRDAASKWTHVATVPLPRTALKQSIPFFPAQWS